MIDFLVELNERTVIHNILNEMAGKKPPYNFDHKHRYDYGYDYAQHNPAVDDPRPEVSNSKIEQMLDYIRKRGGESIANSIAAASGSNINRMIDQLNDEIAKRQERGTMTDSFAKNAKNFHKVLVDLDKLYSSELSI